MLWFLRRADRGQAPKRAQCRAQDAGDGPVTHTYARLPSGWSNYVTSFAGNFAYRTDGVTVLTDETVYVILDQFTGFTAGDYKVDFSTGTGAVDKAIMLRNVRPTDAGTFYAGMSQTPTWSMTYVGNAPADNINNFPRTLSIGGRCARTAVYAIYQMSGYG